MTLQLQRLVAGLSAALSLAFAAHAADAVSPQAKYEQQRAACNAGKSNQDKATCLKEAGAALGEAKRGRLNDADADYRRNETERCKTLTGDEQRDCLARMKGSGSVSGSVGSGGILREKRTKEVVRPAETIPAEPAASAGG